MARQESNQQSHSRAPCFYLRQFQCLLERRPLQALTNPAFIKPALEGYFPALPANPNASYRNSLPALGDAAGYNLVSTKDVSFSGEVTEEGGWVDHSLAGPSPFRLVTGAPAWPINADEPPAIDYKRYFQSTPRFYSALKSPPQLTSYYAPDPFRSSIRDPLIVGFSPLPGDLNDDGVVNPADQQWMTAHINRPPIAANCRMDFDGDGVISLNDYRLWVTAYLAYQRVSGNL